MGGSSTQLIFFNGRYQMILKSLLASHCVDERPDSSAKDPLSEQSFWSHSWLNFGVEIIKEKVLEHIRDSFLSDRRWKSATISTDGTVEELVVDEAAEQQDVQGLVVENPCSPVDHDHLHGDGVRFRGTGDGQLCTEIIKSVIWHESRWLLFIHIHILKQLLFDC